MNQSFARPQLPAVAIEDRFAEKRSLGANVEVARSDDAAVVESKARSILKAMSWRTTASIDTFIVSLLITGRLKLALSIGGLELFTKLALYYVHERVWNKVTLGRARARPDYEI
jgi:uncharacterized membrane protein